MFNKLEKHPHNNPLIFFMVNIKHIESYDNLFLMMVDIFFYVAVLFSYISPLWFLEVETWMVE